MIGDRVWQKTRSNPVIIFKNGKNAIIHTSFLMSKNMSTPTQVNYLSLGMLFTKVRQSKQQKVNTGNFRSISWLVLSCFLGINTISCSSIQVTYDYYFLTNLIFSPTWCLYGIISVCYLIFYVVFSLLAKYARSLKLIWHILILNAYPCPKMSTPTHLNELFKGVIHNSDAIKTRF